MTALAYIDAVIGADLTHAQRVVAVYIARRVGRNGEAWPHLSTIAEAVRMTERGAWGAIETLEASGWLTVARPSAADRSRGQPTKYALSVPAGHRNRPSGEKVADTGTALPVEHRNHGSSSTGTTVHRAPEPPFRKSGSSPLSEMKEPVEAEPGPRRTRSEQNPGTPFSENLELLWRRWAKSYAKARGQIAADDSGAAKREVCRVITEHADLRGESFVETLDGVLERYWRDAWPRQHANRAGLRNLLSQLSRLLDEAGGEHDMSDRDPPDYDPRRHGAPHEIKNFAAWNHYGDVLAGRA